MNKTIDDNYPEISVRLLKWYDHNRRNLPWRALPGEKSNPYYVLLSEIITLPTFEGLTDLNHISAWMSSPFFTFLNSTVKA